MSKRWSRDLGYDYVAETWEEGQARLEAWFGTHKFQRRLEVDRCAICDQVQLNPMHKTGAQQ